jgi:arsenate reductase (thioredoxin)
MAEGFVNHDLGGSWSARSAGTQPAARVHPFAVKAMAETGVDIAAAQPRSVSDVLDEPWDLVLTVCDAARESCPVFPRAVPRRHLFFDDPAAAEGDDDAKMAVFRRVRDEIRERVIPLLRGLPPS